MSTSGDACLWTTPAPFPLISSNSFFMRDETQCVQKERSGSACIYPDTHCSTSRCQCTITTGVGGVLSHNTLNLGIPCSGDICEHPCSLATAEALSILGLQANVETKLACALASSELRQQLVTSCCWPQEVWLDLHDSRQLKWLQRHIGVVERLSICLEDSLIGRFNRLLRCAGAPHLTSLSIHMAPDDVEHNRMQVFQLRGLRLETLSLHHRGWSPVFSTHHLPTTLRSLTFSDLQESDAHVFFRGQEVRECLSLEILRPVWSFARQLPTSLTRLTLTCDTWNLRRPATLRLLETFSGLEELHIHAATNYSVAKRNLDIGVSIAEALASLSLKRVGLHACSGCIELYIPASSLAEVHRSFYIGGASNTTNYRGAPFRDQMDDGSRPSVTKLTLHFQYIRSCPVLSGFSALRELVLADVWREFSEDFLAPFSVKGLGAVAATLRHLTVSSSRNNTHVVLPSELRLSSFVCVCSGALRLNCDAHTLGQGLGDVLLGYRTLAGTGARLVEVLGPRLSAAVLQVLGPESLRQSVLFTRARLVGEWWHGVFQASKQQDGGGCLCCRVQIWAQGCLCPPYLTFSRYGIISAHEDRGVVGGKWDLMPGRTSPQYPAWHRRR